MISDDLLKHLKISGCLSPDQSERFVDYAFQASPYHFRIRCRKCGTSWPAFANELECCCAPGDWNPNIEEPVEYGTSLVGFDRFTVEMEGTEYRKYARSILDRPMISSEDKHLLEIAMEYEYRCETFDRAVCFHSGTDVAIPRWPYERKMCESNALAAKRDIMSKYGLDYERFNYALGLFHNAYPQGMNEEVLKEFEELRASQKRPVV